jgi:hypothetical protein
MCQCKFEGTEEQAPDTKQTRTQRKYANVTASDAAKKDKIAQWKENAKGITSGIVLPITCLSSGNDRDRKATRLREKKAARVARVNHARLARNRKAHVDWNRALRAWRSKDDMRKSAPEPEHKSQLSLLIDNVGWVFGRVHHSSKRSILCEQQTICAG